MKLAIAVALAACVPTDPDQLAQRYERAKYCPSERVHVGLVPELGLAHMHVAAAPIDPWHEPELPAEVAADPARRGLWQAQRDGAWHAWQARQRANDRVDQAEWHTPIYAATGCGGTELFVCRSYRHSIGCTQITDALAAERLVCRDGRAVHAIGDAIGCVDGPPLGDPSTCAVACVPADACARTCTDVRCRLACAEAEIGCRFACVDATRVGCIAAGLDRFGLCEGITSQARALDDAQRSIATTAASVKARLDALHR
jgi:hypothetical protein